MTKPLIQKENNGQVSHGNPDTQRPGLDPLSLWGFDLPHEDSKIEWWYLNAHVQDASGNEYSCFASFFKLAVALDEKTGRIQFAYSITWALTDLSKGNYYRESVLDRCAPAVGLETMKKKQHRADKRMQAALKEVLEQNRVPFPDRLASAPAQVDWNTLNLNFEGNTLRVEEDGTYALFLVNETDKVSLNMRFNPRTQAVKHGDDGVVVGTSGEDMFYYFIPNNEVHGEIHIDGESRKVSGKGWYDHEFALKSDGNEEEIEVNLLQDIGWNWISLQLDNSTQLTAYDLFERTEEMRSAGRWSVLVSSDGTPEYPANFSFTPLEFWTSSKTFISYPVKWSFKIPEYQIDLVVAAAFPEQEFISLLSEPAFWEGRVHAEGTVKGVSIKAKGYVELSGNALMETMEDFLKAVTRTTFKSINKLLPLSPTDDEFVRLVASPSNRHFLQGLSKEQFVSQVIVPIRDIIDRGGKSWRSYAALACIDLAGGDSQPYLDWLAWPELLHTGSLIIDDIQDESLIRRGGPSCHAKYGTAIAINAGNAAYFLGQILILDESISMEKKLKLYETYFETMRAAHAGQAMDISSFYDTMNEVVIHGRAAEMEEKVLSVHRLKSAVPAAMLARIGAIKGNADRKTEDRLAAFFESLGLAFQIMDDVLNLKGFERGLKDKGEDIRAGKITMPVVKSMGLLPMAERKALWDEIKSRPDSVERIGAVIAKLNACGAIEACEKQASDMVEQSWNLLQECIEPSLTSVRLRAFSWFVLNRHY